MSRKFSHNYRMFNAVVATSTQTSEEVSVLGIDKLSIHAKFSANNSGTFTLQARNSDVDSWFDVDFNVAMTITADNEALLIMNEVPFDKIKLTWTPSAGSGTLTAVLKMKNTGA